METDKYKETFETWNKVAKLYEEKFMDLTLYDDTYDAFCGYLLKKNATVLEIGCGPGNITKYLLNKRPDFNIEAIDIAQNMLDLAKKNNPGASFKLMDSRNIDLLKSKYDGAVGGFCLPYLSETDCHKLLNDLKNLLDSKAVLYLSFVEGKENESGFKTGSSGDRTYFYYHNVTILKQLLKENNFEILELIHKNYPKSEYESEIHTIIIAEKRADI